MASPNRNLSPRALGDCCLIPSTDGYMVVTPLGEVHRFDNLQVAQQDLLTEFYRDLDRHNHKLVEALGGRH